MTKCTCAGIRETRGIFENSLGKVRRKCIAAILHFSVFPHVVVFQTPPTLFVPE